MKSPDPLEHYIKKAMLQEATLSDYGATQGLTSDMVGRWTINSYDTGKKREKPVVMKELIFKNNAGVMEVFKFFEVADIEDKNKFDTLINSGQEKTAWELIQKVLNVKLMGKGPWSG